MKKIIVVILIVIVSSLFTEVFSQENIRKIELSGIVKDFDTSEPLEMVVVSIRELNLWVTTDSEGRFKFKKFPKGKYTIYASCLGYKDYLFTVELNRDISNYSLMLKKRNLKLKEVLVTAEENRGNGTGSTIEKSAIEHIQPMSLSDIMQLVPGNISLNPNLSSVNQIAIREIYDKEGPYEPGTLGTAIIINGNPLSNDANLQVLSTSKSGTDPGFPSSAGGGVDLRQITTDNIESVEVVRGIPSVEYGELTSGAVIVKTKAGKSPMTSKIKIDPNTKQIYAGKGFYLGENKGAMNFDINYTSSYKDLRTQSKSFNRLTGQIAYSNVFGKGGNPLSFNSQLSFYSTIDEYKDDKDMVSDELEKSEDKGVSLNISGNWALNKDWITNIKYSLSGSYAYQESYMKKLQSIQGPTPISLALHSGESLGLFPVNEYYSKLSIDGEPINIFAKVTANLAGKYGKIYNKVLLGAEWRTNGNNGKGRQFDMSKPYSPGVENALRPRSYRDIPFLNQYSVFVEDKLKLPLGSTVLDVQGGLRINNLRPKGLFDTRFEFTYEPRVNLKYRLLSRKNNKIFEDFTLRGGYGITVKNPALVHFFTDPVYYDMISFNSYPDMVLMTTQIIENTDNPDLKPAKNTKQEAGADFKIKGVSVSLTAFKETLKDGFSFCESVYPLSYRSFAEPVEGVKYEYKDGQLYADGELAEYTETKRVQRYRIPQNSYRLEKEGIEYVVNLGKIKALRTSLIVDGAYLRMKRINTTESYYVPSGKEKTLPYIGILPAGEGFIRERFNSNFRLITHIPEIRMVLSLTTQVIWNESRREIYETIGGRVIPYMRDEQGKKIYGDNVYYNTEMNKYVNPVKYVDIDGGIHQFTMADEEDSYLKQLIKSNNNNKFYIEDSYPATVQVNMRLSKEIGKNAALSFFANNLLNHRPIVRMDRTNSNVLRNSSFYFGAELKFKF